VWSFSFCAGSPRNAAVRRSPTPAQSGTIDTCRTRDLAGAGRGRRPDASRHLAQLCRRRTRLGRYGLGRVGAEGPQLPLRRAFSARGSSSLPFWGKAACHQPWMNGKPEALTSRASRQSASTRRRLQRDHCAACERYCCSDRSRVLSDYTQLGSRVRRRRVRPIRARLQLQTDSFVSLSGWSDTPKWQTAIRARDRRDDSTNPGQGKPAL
jgi:hypothetical protein